MKIPRARSRDRANFVFMKCIFPLPGGRGAGWTVLVALLSASHALLADVSKGTTRQRQLLQTKPTGAVTTPAKQPAQCSSCCPANLSAGETIKVTTGNQIPKVSRKRGPITDGAQNVQALDRKQLERTGATTVSDALRRLVP